MQMFPREVILAIVVLDLPINFNDNKRNNQIAEGYGASWWYLNCDCDDFYVDVVEEIIDMCTFAQILKLCFAKKDNDENSYTVLSRATPKCRDVLQRSLRFAGRYEFIDSSPIESNVSLGLKVFDALDFGTKLDPLSDGKRVLLHCYSKEEYYIEQVRR